MASDHPTSLSLSLSLSLMFPGECPKGPAWADKPYALDLAHQSVECSNAGICDRATGSCKCFPGFTGSSCQRSKYDI